MKTYSIISQPTTVDIQDKEIVEKILKGMVSAYEKGQKAAETGNWLDFSTDLFESSKSVVTSFLAKGNNSSNDTVSEMDELLLAFIVIESQISHLYAESMDLLITVNGIIEGILNIHQQTLNTNILSQETTEKMVDKINALYFPEQKVGIEKKDLMNDNVGICRWMSNQM